MSKGKTKAETMSKYGLDIKAAFEKVQQLKDEESQTAGNPAPVPAPIKKLRKKSNIDKINIEKNNIGNINVEQNNIDIKKQPKQKRERQSVTALRAALLRRLGNEKQTLVKLGEIAEEIGFDLSGLHSAKKELADRGEFTFMRYIQGKDGRGLLVSLGSRTECV